MLASRYLNIPHRLWRLGRLASSCLIAAALSLVGVAVVSGSNILGGVTTIGGQPWAAGIYDDGGSVMPLIEHR